MDHFININNLILIKNVPPSHQILFQCNMKAKFHHYNQATNHLLRGRSYKFNAQSNKSDPLFYKQKDPQTKEQSPMFIFRELTKKKGP